MHVLYRDVLGIAEIDLQRKEVTLQFSDLKLDACKGEMPAGDEVFRLEWKRTGNTISYHFSGPIGYKVLIKNNSDLNLEAK